MKITRNDVQTGAGPSDWFTGAAYLDTVATRAGASRLGATSIHFTPGARTAWHATQAAPPEAGAQRGVAPSTSVDSPCSS